MSTADDVKEDPVQRRLRCLLAHNAPDEQTALRNKARTVEYNGYKDDAHLYRIAADALERLPKVEAELAKYQHGWQDRDARWIDIRNELANRVVVVELERDAALARVAEQDRRIAAMKRAVQQTLKALNVRCACTETPPGPPTCYNCPLDEDNLKHIEECLDQCRRRAAAETP